MFASGRSKAAITNLFVLRALNRAFSAPRICRVEAGYFDRFVREPAFWMRRAATTSPTIYKQKSVGFAPRRKSKYKMSKCRGATSLLHERDEVAEYY